MADTESQELAPGQSTSRDNGERFGRSTGGHRVLLRRRVTEAGFVVSVDAPARPNLPTEIITKRWEAANAAFDRMLHEY